MTARFALDVGLWYVDSVDLPTLRKTIAEVDEQLIELLARRGELSRQVGQLKGQAGLAIRDFAQERQVIERARTAAVVRGVSPKLAETVMLSLIEAALAAQEQDKVSAQGSGLGRKALVIGGGGRMGRWMIRFLSAQGFACEVADPHAEVQGVPCVDDWHRGNLHAEFIVVAAPLRVTGEILHELAALRPQGTVFDIGSLKSPLRTGLWALRDAGVNVGSLHPMFGPSTELLSGRHVIVVDVGNAKVNAQLRQLFAPTMATIIEMDLERHDRLIAYVLGLSHALNISFMTALADSGEHAEALAELSSTTFDAQLAVARSVARENPELYFEIQSLNDYGGEALAALLHAVERVRSSVRANDRASFTRLMTRGRSYLERSD